VKVSRNGEYANIVDLERWPDGAILLTDQLKASLKGLDHAPVTPQPQAAQSVQPAGTPQVRW
jgi:hypothetical protein